VRKIYHKPEGENVWYRVKGITLEQCEDLLTKCGYNVQSKAFRNQWRRFISLPYCPFNVLYSGVLEPPQEKAKDFIHHKQQYRYTQKDDDEDGDMEMSLFQFAGTKMMTLDKFRYVLRQLRFSLPPDIEISIFNKCDNPPPSTPFGVLKNFYNNSVLSVKMLGSDFKAILESTKQEIAHAKIYEELRKMCEDSKAELEVEQTEKVRLLISNGKKIIGKEKGYYKVKEQLTELETVAMNTQSNPDKIAALKRVIEIIQTDLRSPRYIVKDGRDDFSSEQFVSQAVQLILHEDKALNLKINDKDQSLILPGPNKIRLYIADKISFESASKEATANTYKTIKELPSFSFPQSGQEDGTNPDTPNESIEKLWAKVEQELNKGADHSAADNCIVTLSMRCLEGYIGDWRGAVVSITDLKDAFCEYVKRGLVFEACQQICKDRLGLTYSSETLRRAFDAVDVDKNGYLEPHEFYLMLLKLFKMGMTFEHMHALMTRLGLKIEKAALLRTFQMMDVDQDGSLGTTEFITGIETLLSTVIPTTVLEKMHLTPTHIIVGITVALLILLLMFVFIFLSMSAFTGPAATSAGIQSVLMAGAAFVVKGEYNAPDLEKLRSSIKEHINAVMGIDKKQAAQAGKDLKKNK
jgi:Ca2+-binding EF-hand superfamily protein